MITTIFLLSVEAVFVLSLLVIATLLWRHRGHWFVRFEDLEQHEREYHRKQEMIVNKIERSILQCWHQTIAYGKPIVHGLRDVVRQWYTRLWELEKRYRKSVAALKLSGPKRVELISKILKEAEEAVESEEWPLAEQKFVEVLTMQKSHIRAYEGLGEVYWNNKQWKEAMETYRFLSRLLKEKTPIGYYHRCGECAIELGKYAQAIEAFERALLLEPSHPRTLDLLIESAILGANVDVATRGLEKLKEVNPENQKISEFEDKIKELRASMVSKATP